MPGIVRNPRRPAGWQAPGPPPTGACDMLPAAGEDLCFLCGDWRIFQLVDGHRWSLDDLITAWVARAECRQAPAKILDLGCGIGSVLLMMAWSFPDARVVGVEAQEVSVDLARRSLQWNGADRRCEVRCGDLRDPTPFSAGESFQLITATPPYFPRGSALESQRPQWAACHVEHRGGVEAYCAAAAPRLADGGTFVMCAAARDVERVEVGARQAGLHIRSRLDVIPRDGKDALFSVYVMQREVLLESPVESSLVVRDRAGHRTTAYQQVRHDMGMPP